MTNNYYFLGESLLKVMYNGAQNPILMIKASLLASLGMFVVSRVIAKAGQVWGVLSTIP